MTKDLLVRNVPKRLQHWIDSQLQERQMSQQEFVLSLLQTASSPAPQTLALPFEHVRKSRTPDVLPFTFIRLFARTDA